jgi:hypothetical protein
MAVQVDNITATPHNLQDLLSNKRYGLDFYQREYSWEEAQVVELIDDLVSRFLDGYRPGDVRKDVAGYEPYFLGPIVTSQRDDLRYLVDGQQRVTTLTLILIRLGHLLDQAGFTEDAASLGPLIFSSKFGESRYNLDVDERTKCLEAIRAGEDFEIDDTVPESVRNLWYRNATIEERFPAGVEAEQLPFFSDWLLNRVILVDIGTPSPDMALEIFESMNDRGLRLSSTDMLKSYLLGRIGDEQTIRRLNDEWRLVVRALIDDEKNADSDFAKAWLRGKYAETIRQGKVNAAPGDYDLIGTAFHKWVRDKRDAVGLNHPADYRRIVEAEFLPLGRRYLNLLTASTHFEPGLEGIFYLSATRFTQHLPVIIAAIDPSDDIDTIREKTRLICTAIDIYLARRIVNYRQSGHSTVKFTMFNLTKAVRSGEVESIRAYLAGWLNEETERLGAVDNFRLHQMNRRQIHYLLARITAWLDEETGHPGTFPQYVDHTQKHPFEVEHIVADKYDRHKDAFASPHDFAEYRNHFGGLLLLPKDFNASYGAMPYHDKVEHYRGQNLLAQSLHPGTYLNNPSFKALIETYQLDFQPHPEVFDATAMAQRQALYKHLVEIIWDPARSGLAPP